MPTWTNESNLLKADKFCIRGQSLPFTFQNSKTEWLFRRHDLAVAFRPQWFRPAGVVFPHSFSFFQFHSCWYNCMYINTRNVLHFLTRRLYSCVCSANKQKIVTFKQPDKKTHRTSQRWLAWEIRCMLTYLPN